MKKLLLIMALCIGFIACSSDDDDNSENPVTNIEVPQSSADSPVKSGETVTIKGNGFTQSSEIWLRALTKSTANNDVKAEITSVTTTGISFIAPSVSGENNIILKQSREEYVIGKMYFDNAEESVVKKRIIKRDFSFNDEDEIFEYSYKDGRLETMLEKMSDGDTYEYKFVYDTDGKLLSVNETNYKTKAKQSDKVFEYKNAQTILVHETFYDGEDNETITLTLNDKGLLVKKESQSDVTEYEYDVSGNITKSIEDGTYVYTYTYDDKYSYLSNQGLPVWYWVYDANENFDIYAGKNNMITLTEDGTLEDLYKFDYDEDGYPVIVYDKGNSNKKIGEFVYEVVE
ncbi:hypothetical protein D0T84_20160 [Dysgonomonas sp. 521]|uniref:hypothetical protein n=1 Tax=Dysgonomonas sp. 521 TaxID=2302932 RepID=UPI0013D57919|nr:hypothetical protein [Dysgonomonas sp. 521]NDV97198.1 hypothetical protein [Dysgonomonas sp. 521]